MLVREKSAPILLEFFLGGGAGVLMIKLVQDRIGTGEKMNRITSVWWDFPGGTNNRLTMQETQETAFISETGRSPGGGNGNPLSVLAWKIPWTEEPGRLQSTGSQRVGHD